VECMPRRNKLLNVRADSRVECWVRTIADHHIPSYYNVRDTWLSALTGEVAGCGCYIAFV
jgi:hypothetical protein